MSSAIDNSNQKITISMAESSDYENPLCCEFCDALVGFVNGYPREVGEKIIFVNPFFRLKKGYIHSSECQYNIKGQIKIIVRESEGDILAYLESGRFELRLLAVKKAIKELQEIANKKIADSNESISHAKEKEYVRSKTKLNSYINDAQRVLKVRAFCEDNTEIENVLELVFDGVRLSWCDFYYEDEDYFRCFSYVSKASISVPVAVKGVVKSINVVKGKANDFSVINLVGPYRKTGLEGVLDAANLSIWSPDLNAFKSYETDDEILAFGVWQAQDIKETVNRNEHSAVKAFRNYSLYLWPHSRAQLCKA